MASPSLLVFGSQTPWPPSEHQNKLRNRLLKDRALNPFLSSIRELPSVWKSIVRAEPRLDRIEAQEQLDLLLRWIDEGAFPPSSGPSPNVLATPLTVIFHLIQYLDYLRDTGSSHAQVLQAAQHGGFQGFCSGLLSALVLACSRNEDDINKLGSVAIRIALVVGAFIDLDSIESEFACLAVRYKSNTDGEEVEQLIQQFQGVCISSSRALVRVLTSRLQAYISAISDARSLSITTPKQACAEVTRSLSNNGINVKSVEVQGRFHHPELQTSLEKAKQLCLSAEIGQFPSADRLLVPVRSNEDGQVFSSGSLHERAIECMMCKRADWFSTVSNAISHLQQSEETLAVVFGFVEAIPPSLSQTPSLRVVRLWKNPTNSSEESIPEPIVITPSSSQASPENLVTTANDPIAIIGTGCKFPGASSVAEFWKVIREGRSMVQPVPETRFQTENLRRSSPGTTFYGNFVDDVDAFDHKFFKKSSREAVQMDPQQRLLLEVAYQTLQSAGYFGHVGKQADDVGCYIGVCANDYNDNVASWTPTAFSSLGTLRAFISGKVSHFFKWSGPSITYDTACSSSLVAIHEACRAVASGECSMALAGGVNVFANPNFFQNLMGASFLSPTGPTKAFDASADGYCRGEGVGLVALKRLSQAEKDGDNILGIIGGTAVNQGTENPITVPHSEAQLKLYNKVTSMAEVDPQSVTFVEAHGTGTPVGDPIEVESIRAIFGGKSRAEVLHLGSIKSNIGHAESASGVAALIKLILMLQHEEIPVQANFTRLNPKISNLEHDRMKIPLKTEKWNAAQRIACINNYGAAGSNAACIVKEAPRRRQGKNPELKKYPIFVSAHSPQALSHQCRLLSEEIRDLKTRYSKSSHLLGDVAFSLAQQQNHTLSHGVAATVSSIRELEELLESASSGQNVVQIQAQASAFPVVLVFGGQTSDTVGIPEHLYHSSSVLKESLDECDSILQSLGYGSLYPSIFKLEPVNSTVLLHAMLFSVQYSGAKAWVDCGLAPARVMGHSFGQISALVFAGSMSLADGIRYVTGRASLIEKHWGEEPGTMISLQADLPTVNKILSRGTNVEIACYNGPTSHVLVGSKEDVDKLEKNLKGNSDFPSVKYKRLSVTHGFHSRFCDNLVPKLQELAEEISFSEPKIPVETCSDGGSWPSLTPALLAQHTRAPVFFTQAVERVSKQLGSCIWLEAGANSGVTGMVRGIVTSITRSENSFLPVTITKGDATGSVAECTANLWKMGHRVQFWPFNRKKEHYYSWLDLPAYPFEKTRHWLEWIDHAAAPAPTEDQSLQSSTKETPQLLQFSGYKDKEEKISIFRISPHSHEYESFVQGHAVLAEPLCPAPLYIDLVARAAQSLTDADTSMAPSIRDLEIKSPLGYDPDRQISLTLELSGDSKKIWRFEMSSELRGKQYEHASGQVSLDEHDRIDTVAEFSRYQRLINPDAYQNLEADRNAQSMSGSLIYKMFSQVVSYADFYKGVRTISAKGNSVTAEVVLPSQAGDLLKGSVHNPLAIDNFIQVSGLHVNCLDTIDENEVYVCTRVDRLSTGFDAEAFHDLGKPWRVFSLYEQIGEKEINNDIFVFDENHQLHLVIHGARFMRVSISSLTRVLHKANAGTSQPSKQIEEAAEKPKNSTAPKGTTPKTPAANEPTPTESGVSDSSASNVVEVASKPAPAKSANVRGRLKKLLAEMLEIEEDSITDDSPFEELGVDSLLATELLQETAKEFKLDIPMDDWVNLQVMKQLIDYLNSKLGTADAGSDTDSSQPSTTQSPDQTLPTSPAASSDVTTVTDDSEAPPDALSRLQKLVASDSKLGKLLGDKSKLREAGLGSLLRSGISKEAEPEMTEDFPLQEGQQSFDQIRQDYDIHAKKSGFSNFWSQTYPQQANLVTAYTVEAFDKLDCSLSELKEGDDLPPLKKTLPKHDKEVAQLYNILEDASLIRSDGSSYKRTATPLPSSKSGELSEDIVKDFPQHATEHKLLNITGSNLAECLTGEADPLVLLFRSKENRTILEDVYRNGPMYSAVTEQLGSFLVKAMSNGPPNGRFKILEIGAGTGGTTNYILQELTRKGIPFQYTFSDLGSSLVAAAKRNFKQYSNMDFRTLDIEKEPPSELLNKYHVVLSTNCVHATKSLTTSGTNIRKLLREDGFLSLVEFTRNMFWFDLVFGLLDGWWSFEDGRPHVLATQWFWQKSLNDAGFKHVTWTEGPTEESNTLRIVTGFPAPPAPGVHIPQKPESASSTKLVRKENVEFDKVGNLSLTADIYFPLTQDAPTTKRPVGMLKHSWFA